ncbi:MAG: hypothetical protein ABH967_01895 [Patescibacteria group bacterium]
MKNILKRFLNPFVLIMGVLALLAIVFIYGQEAKTKTVLSSEVVAERALNYINENMMSGDLTASLINIEKSGDLYKIGLKIDGQEYTSYASLDGSLLFPEGVSLVKEEVIVEEEPEGMVIEDEDVLSSLAKCLTDKGFKFYGASWCGYCQKQKELFKGAVVDLPYIECAIEGQDEIAKECVDAGVSSFPTWRLPDGTNSSGFKKFEELIEISGCSIEN